SCAGTESGWCVSTSPVPLPWPGSSRSPPSFPSWVPSSVTGCSSGSSPASRSPSPPRSSSSARPSTTSTAAWPSSVRKSARGAVNSEFGMRQSPWTKAPEFHGGMDIGANRGTAVQAPAAGTVVFAGTAPEYGNAVIVDHGQDIKSLYGHLSEVSVKPGQKVERGTLLAHTGNTGRSSGPHLHYEILVKGRAVNPRAYLWD